MKCFQNCIQDPSPGPPAISLALDKLMYPQWLMAVNAEGDYALKYRGCLPGDHGICVIPET